MKKCYPFLSYWMKIGINKFPQFVDDSEIFKSFVIQHIEWHPEVYRVPPLKVYRENIKNQNHELEVLRKINNPFLNAKLDNLPEFTEQEVWETMIRPDLVLALYESIKRMCEQHKQKDLDLIFNARSQIIYGGKTATDIAEKMGRNLLSKCHGRGGKIFKTEFHREIIKMMYGELRHAITEIRQAVFVPCKIRKNDTWADDDETEQILQSVPGCEEIFDRKELPIMTAMSSVADCAILIIKKRLKSYFPPQSPGPNSIKRLLQKK